MGQPSNFVRQAGAIPVRGGQVCLVLSRSGKRWVVPKGWPVEGCSPSECAALEAFVAAQRRGTVAASSLGAVRRHEQPGRRVTDDHHGFVWTAQRIGSSGQVDFAVRLDGHGVGFITLVAEVRR